MQQVQEAAVFFLIYHIFIDLEINVKIIETVREMLRAQDIV